MYKLWYGSTTCIQYSYTHTYISSMRAWRIHTYIHTHNSSAAWLVHTYIHIYIHRILQPRQRLGPRCLLYMHTYTQTYIYICVHTHIYIYIYIYTHTHTRTYPYVFLHTSSMHTTPWLRRVLGPRCLKSLVRMLTCVCVYMYVCMYVCLHIYICIRL
jgi:hypothetical protein